MRSRQAAQFASAELADDSLDLDPPKFLPLDSAALARRPDGLAMVFFEEFASPKNTR